MSFLLGVVSGDREGHTLNISCTLSYIEIKRKKGGEGSKRIRQLPINWCISPMMIHKIEVVEMFGHSTNQNSSKVPKVVKPTNKKTLL